jgi:DNA-binding NarL/FixJ family response regulator
VTGHATPLTAFEVEMNKIRILIVDDHPVVRQGLRTFFSKCPDLEVAGEAADGLALLDQVAAARPDVVLLDIRMPGMSGIEVARHLRREHPDVKVILLTTYEDEEYLFGALRVGAHAYLLKSASHDMLASAIRSVYAGERLLSPPLVDKVLNRFEELARAKAQQDSGLTEQEAQILRAMESGASNKEIADQLFWSEITVKRKVQDIFEKLGVDNRVKAVAEAIRRGLI